MSQNMLKTGLAWLSNQLIQNASESITYASGDGYQQVDCQATLGKKLLKLDDGMGGFRIEFTEMDFLVRSADLDFGSGWVEPQRGDTIYLIMGPYVHTFEVCPYEKDSCWTWADPHQSMRRIHTKLVDKEPYS